MVTVHEALPLCVSLIPPSYRGYVTAVSTFLFLSLPYHPKLLQGISFNAVIQNVI